MTLPLQRGGRQLIKAHTIVTREVPEILKSRGERDARHGNFQTTREQHLPGTLKAAPGEFQRCAAVGILEIPENAASAACRRNERFELLQIGEGLRGRSNVRA